MPSSGGGFVAFSIVGAGLDGKGCISLEAPLSLLDRLCLKDFP
jgi:hypothetical protein